MSVSCAASRIAEMKSKGDTVIARIENYRAANDKLPNSLTDLGIEEKESGPIYYQKSSEKNYIIWFGMTLGESTTYDSITKTWNK
jgi:hypothetical protein